MPKAMDKKKYIESITSRLTNDKVKKALEEELSDHIEAKEEYWQEIGYDEEQAEKMAVDAMGEAEPIGEQINKVYRENGLDYLRIFLYLLSAVFTCLVYYIGINSHDFSDKNNYEQIYYLTIALLNGCGLSLCSLIAVKNKSTTASVFNLILITICAYHAFSFSVAVSLIFLLFGIFTLFTAWFTISYNRKTASFQNTKRDLKKKHFYIKFTTSIAIISLVAGCVLFGRIINETHKYGEEYKNSTLPTMLEMAENGGYRDKEYIKSKFPDFEIVDEYDDGSYNGYISGVEGSVNYYTANEDFYLQAKGIRNFISFMTYMPYCSIRASKEIVKSTEAVCNEDHFKGKAYKEITDYFLDQNPCDVTIEKNGDEYQLTFGYRRYRILSFEAIVYVTFDAADGSLIRITESHIY
ncbi:MAG: permease prefix domain 1-containing protein [Eubacterium sp.]